MDLIGKFGVILAEICQAGGMPPQHRFHDRSTAQHMLAVVDAADTLFPGDRAVMRAAIAHDLGKLETYDPEDGSFRGHDKVSERLVRECEDCDEITARVVGQHSWIYNIAQAGDKAVAKWWRNATTDLSPEQATEFLRVYRALTLCDAAGFSPEGRDQRYEDLRVFEEKIAKVL